MSSLTDGSVAFDLRKFEFPKVTGLDMEFCTYRTDPALLAEALRRGFYNGHTPGNAMFSTLFYIGGKVNFRKDVPVEFQKNAWNYCRAFMCSFEPKHEEKEAICAMLLTEIADSVGAKARRK